MQVNELKINKEIDEFIPISLKRKKTDRLSEELFEKDIATILDVRRSPINGFTSAKYYFPEEFQDLMIKQGIYYMWSPSLSNRKQAKSSEVFLTNSMKQDVIGVLSNFWLWGKVGVVCYCTEEAQEANQCHASWICNYLNNKLSNTD